MTSPANKNVVSPDQVLNSVEFKELIKARRKLALSIVATIIVTYFGFILMIAFDPVALGTTVGSGTVSIGIYLGLALLVLAFLLTAIYLRVSDGRIEELQQKIRHKFS